MDDQFKQIDKKEVHLPETAFVRDIEPRLFQSIVLQCLAKIEGVAPVGGGILDNLLGRENDLRAVHVDQDTKTHSVKLKVEVNVLYGTYLPEKAEEIQMKVAQEVGEMTGLHVSSVHVVFKNLLLKKETIEQKEEIHAQ